MVTKIGDGKNNTLIGTADNDTLSGLGGNDSLFGRTGDDLLRGGDGNDRLVGEMGLDLLYGGNGNDSLDGWGRGLLYGEGGNDRLIWNPGAVLVTKGLSEKNVFDGGSGQDTLVVTNNAMEDYQATDTQPLVGPAVTRIDLVGHEYFGDNKPVVSIGDFEMDEAPQLWGNVSSIETFDLRGNRAQFWGDSRGSTVLGTEFSDRFFGNAGQDTLEGRGGNDFLHEGGFDRNTLRGGAGNDQLIIDLPSDMTSDKIDGRSILDGGAGTDTLTFKTSLPVNLYVGDSGPSFDENGPTDLDNVILLGDASFQRNTYTDFFNIERFDFSQSTGPFNYASFDPGFDVTVIGTNTATGDTFRDGDGDSILYGMAGSDSFDLLPGTDQASGGNDILHGGAGDDFFAIGFFLGFGESGDDRIVGFEGAGVQGGDFISVQNFSTKVEEIGGNTVFTWGDSSLTVDTVGLRIGIDYGVLE
jgi:Ca2+-binding RTX toxin-like protein